ncbi:MAG TPA: hypothetical protein VE869_02195 [Gemmatimonas sp.]|nr:hypothetical protein [Gemmatimonas sp.]
MQDLFDLHITLECAATVVHLGGTTQVWDATVTHRESSKTLALFRCRQLVLYPR